jgi:hypothetical protein
MRVSRIDVVRWTLACFAVSACSQASPGESKQEARSASEAASATIASGDAGVDERSAAVPSFVGEDLRDYYPNLALYRTQYLRGYNYVTSPPSYAVLWFEQKDSSTFLQHNGAPGDEQASCNTDYLSWWDDGFLRYVRTVNSCGAHTTDIDYMTQNDPIILLPQSWDGRPWSFSSSSPAVYTVDGHPACSGTNAWTAQVLGVEQMAPGDYGLHFRTTQTLTLRVDPAFDWSTFDGGSPCAPTTHWQEDYWLVQDLPIDGGGTTKGLKRTQGGDLDVTTYPAWNIWMDEWAALP